MLYPIAVVMKNSKRKEGILFYDSFAESTKYLRLKEIQDNCEKLRFAGIYVANGMVRLYKYFKNIGVLGGEGEIVDSFTVCRKYISKAGTSYLVVDTVGNQNIVSKAELMRLKADGVNVAGVELQSGGRLLTSSEIETKIIKDECNTLRPKACEFEFSS